MKWFGKCGSAWETGRLFVFAAMAAAAFARAGAADAVSGVSANAYVQDGLVAQWDGIDNTGTGAHDPNATTWTDCVAGYKFDLMDVTVLENGFSFDGKTSFGKMTENANAAFPAGVKTVEVLMKLNAPDAVGVLVHGPAASGVAFGPYQSYILLNNADSGDGYKHPNDCSTNGYATVYGANNMSAKYHLNGSVVESSKPNNNWGSPDNAAWLGRRSGGSNVRYCDATIYALRVYNRELSAEEIAFNASLDAVRFKGEWAGESRAGEDGRLQVRVSVALTGAGGTASVAGGGAEAWVDWGATVPFTISPSGGKFFGRWEGGTPTRTGENAYVIKADKPTALVAYVAPNVPPAATCGYAERGLVACWDGIDNTGGGVHDAYATNWVDCVDGHKFALTDVEVFANGLGFDGVKSFGKMDKYADAAFPAGVKTVEVLMKLDDDATSGVLVHGPTASGVAFGPHQSYILLNNAGYGDGYDRPVAGEMHGYATTYGGNNMSAAYYQDGGAVVGRPASNYWGSADVLAAWLGRRSGDSNPRYCNATLYALRVYNRELSDDEVAVNANVDKMRFAGADPSSLTWPDGYRVDEDGKLQMLFSVTLTGGGGTASVAGGGTETWVELGETVEFSVALDEGRILGRWTGGEPTKTGDGAYAITVYRPTALAACVAETVPRAALSGYVTKGLVAQWDGIDNTGNGGYDPNATSWVDCVAGYKFALTDVETLADGFSFDGTKSFGQMTEDADAAFPSGIKTVEILMKLNAPDVEGILLHGPLKSGVAFGPYQSYILLNNAGYGDGYNHPKDCSTNGYATTYGANNMSATYHLNGSTVERSKPDNMWGSPEDGVAWLGRRSGDSSPRYCKATLYALRVYNRELSAEEIAFNANLDAVRFKGVDPRSLTWPEGYRVGDGGKLQVRVSVTLAGAGGTASVAGGGAEAWVDLGATAAIALDLPAGTSVLRWNGGTPAKTGENAYAVDVAGPIALYAFVGDRARPASLPGYVADGLVAQWDGIDNAAMGVHLAGATKWVDLVRGAEIELPGWVAVEERSLHSASSESHAPVEVASIEGLSSAAAAWTIEIVQQGCGWKAAQYGNSQHVFRTPRGFLGYLGNVENGFRFVGPNSESRCSWYEWKHATAKVADPHTMSAVLGRDGVLNTIWMDGVRDCANTTPSFGEGSKAFMFFGNQHMDVRVFAIRVYNRALSQAEIEVNRAADAARFQGLVAVPADAGCKAWTGSTQVSSIADTEHFRVAENAGGVAVGSYPVVLSLKDPVHEKWMDGTTGDKTVPFHVHVPGALEPSGDDYSNVTRAIAEAADGGTVDLAAGTYWLTNTISLARGVTLKGASRDATVLRSLSANGRGVCVTDADATLEGVTIRDAAFGGGHGGGVLLSAGTVRNCRITECIVYNQSYGGGGVYMTGGTVEDCEIDHCKFGGHNDDNGAGGAGNAIWMVGGTVAGCDIHANDGGYSGEGDSEQGAWQGAGVVFMKGGTLTRSKIRGNRKKTVAGIYQHGGRVVSCLLADNVSTNVAASVYKDGGETSNCTIHNCTRNGAAGRNGFWQTGGATTNCIVWNSRPMPPESSGVRVDGGTFVSCATEVEPASAANGVEIDVLTDDPRFVDAAGGNLHLSSGSPYRKAGIYEPWMKGAFDLDGKRRAPGDMVDLGCYQRPSGGLLMRVR